MASYSDDPPELEALAEAFYDTMKERQLIQDRKYNFKTYSNVFLGTDAVTVLVELLLLQQAKTTTKTKKIDQRQEAIHVGRQIAAKYQLFCHTHNDHELKDDKLFYRFQNNLPRQVAKATLGMNLSDKINLWEKNVNVQDRTYRLRSYSQCFVAREAIDVLMSLKLVTSRQDAVELVREMNRRCYVCEHVCRDHDFCDEYLFFRFLPKYQRMIDMEDEGQAMNCMLDALSGRRASSIDGFSQQDVFHTSEKDLLLGQEDVDATDDTPPSSSRTGRRLSSMTTSRLLPPGKSLKDIAQALERDLEVKDRRYRLTVYKNCFIAKDAVTYMVDSNIASSRSKAELLGRHLEVDMNLFHHVTKDHNFRDKPYFFRFTPPEERKTPPSSLAVAGQDQSILFEELESPDSTTLVQQGQQQRLMRSQEGHDLEDIATAFEEGVRVQNLKHRLKTYENVFRGSEAVDYLVSQDFASDRRGAVLLGKVLAEDCLLFEHVTGSLELADDNFFYRFIPTEERKARLAMKQERDLKIGARQLPRLSELDFPGGEQQEDEQGSKSDWQTDIDADLLEIYSVFRQGIRVKNNRFRGKLYRNTFIGSEAVDFMVNSSLASSRKEAIELGRRIMNETKRFRHVTDEWPFSDDYKFYRFVDDSSHSGLDSSSRSGFSMLSFRSDPSKALSEEFQPLEKIAEDFIKHVKVQDRRYMFTTYKNVFTGSEAVDYMVGKTRWFESRQEALQIGQRLMRELDLFKHVTNAHSFKDEMLFYEFTDVDTESFLKRVQKRNDESLDTLAADESNEITPSRLIQAARAIEVGLTPTDNRYRLRVYKDTVIGSDIISILVDSDLASSRTEALRLGRIIAKQFHLFEHVTMDHLLKDERLFYRFVRKSNRGKGYWFKDTYGCKLINKMFSICSKEDLSTKEYWDILLDIVVKGTWDLETEKDIGKIKEFEVTSEDPGWNRRVKTFQYRLSKSILQSKRFAGIALPKYETETGRLKLWSSTFLRLDPRYQIYHCFNEIAQTGAELVEDGAACFRARTREDIHPLLFQFLPFNLAPVFTVWRPTSFDAIRKMMVGDAVGKGLDIKGKSAKRGKLSGFVPFLQISDNKHKSKVRRLSRDSKVRVFYKSNCRRARDTVAAELEVVLEDMLQTVEEAKKILSSESADSGLYTEAMDCMLLEMAEPYVSPIEDYAPECYGLEMPERLFWEAYFVRQDCTRRPGTIYDTGRPSQPEYQDMNFAALRKAQPTTEGGAKAVIYQNADRDDPMNPFELLVAYEENGKVLPVVSDFDCFLVGTRRAQYTMPLPLDQLNVLHWCVDQIEEITKKMIADHGRGKNQQKTWTVLWLEVLKKASNDGFHPEIPQLGFGDPKSYCIIENAVKRLITTGAVRHGAECFNYYFPQDLDEQYLVIAQGIGEGGSVPWKYVDAEELLSILSSKIDEGFTFPLNPKWILMDGWKSLYDKLLESDNNFVRSSMDIWFPPESGLREKIDRIHKLQENLRKLRRQSQEAQGLTVSQLQKQNLDALYFM